MAITISANRERDFFPAGTERLPLFEQDQSLGGWFEQVAKGLTTAEMRLSLSNSAGGVVVLDNPSSWQSFISTYLRSSLPDVTDRAVAEKLGETLGISLPNLVMFLDDVVQHATTGLVWDATRDSDVARVTRLYEPGASYANWTRYQELYNGETPTAKVATEPEASLTVDLRPAIHADIMAETPLGIFGLDRMEVEGSRDFVYSDDSDDKFAKAVSNVAWRGLDLDELDRVDWADEARVNLLLSYAGPLHLEKRVRNGETEYRLRNQPFKEIYLETEDGLLARHALSLRVRLRPEQDRGLIQMKLELPPNEVTGLPVRQKWERRFRGSTYLRDLDVSLAQLLEMTRFGLFAGVGLPELKKLFDILVAAGAVPADGRLELRPDHVIYQQRRRARLLHDSLQVATERRDRLRVAATPTAHPNLHRFLAHVEQQVDAFTACDDAVFRHTKAGDRLEGECVLMSWDRWSVFEPGAARLGEEPEGLRGPGLRGRGLRTETELDAWTTQSLDEALDTIARKRVSGSHDPTVLDRDEAAIRHWQKQLWHDTTRTAEMMAKEMLSAGLEAVSGPTLAKSEQAVAMIASGQGGYRRGHRFWW